MKRIWLVLSIVACIVFFYGIKIKLSERPAVDSRTEFDRRYERLFTVPSTGVVNTCSLSADGRMLAVDYYSPSLRVDIWEVSTGRRLQSFPGRGVDRFSPHGPWIILYVEKTAEIRGISSGELVDSADSEWTTSFYQDTGWAATEQWRPAHRIHLWDKATGHRLATFAGGYPFYFSSENDIFTVRHDRERTAEIWRVSTSKLLRTAQLCDWLYLSPDGQTVAVVNREENEMRLEEAITGNVLKIFKNHNAITFSPDGRLAALESGSSQNLGIRLWDIRAGRLINSFDGSLSCVFSPDGKWIAETRFKEDGPPRTSLWEISTSRRLETVEDGRWPRFSPDSRFFVVSVGVEYHATNPPRSWEKLWDVAGRKWLASFHNFCFSKDHFLLGTVRDSDAILWAQRPGWERRP